jgi:PAS domain-containing protein
MYPLCNRKKHLPKIFERKRKEIQIPFESATDAVFITDKQLKFVELNPAAASIFAHHANGLPDQTLYDFIADKEQVDFIKHQLSQNCNIQNLEIGIGSKDNEILTCQLFLSIIPGASINS